MFISLSQLTHRQVLATDGEIGRIRAAFFDDTDWVIRYLVVDVGSWLTGRLVLISPYAVDKALGDGLALKLSISKEEVKGSPDIDTHQPISRQHELAYLSYFNYPEYWAGSGLWAMGGYPDLVAVPDQAEVSAQMAAIRRRTMEAGDVHLRDSRRVTGYAIKARDNTIGHVDDFLFEASSWAIRYLVVKTGSWWPGGQQVMVSVVSIEQVDWASKTVQVNLTQAQVKASPLYQGAQELTRSVEQRLQHAHGQRGYWD